MEQQPNSPPDLETVARLRECLLNVRSRVDPLLRGKERTSRAELCEILPLPEATKLNVSVAYAIASLTYTYLRMRGINPLLAFHDDAGDQQPHPVMKELQRIEKLIKEIQKIEPGGVKGQESTPKQVERKPAVNQKASRRMIFASLVGNDALDAKTAARISAPDSTASKKRPRSSSNSNLSQYQNRK